MSNIYADDNVVQIVAADVHCNLFFDCDEVDCTEIVRGCEQSLYIESHEVRVAKYTEAFVSEDGKITPFRGDSVTFTAFKSLPKYKAVLGFVTFPEGTGPLSGIERKAVLFYGKDPRFVLGEVV